jgi:hypothetical protein
MSVVLLLMARVEDVEDLGGLVGAPAEAEVNPVLPEAEVNPRLPSDAGEAPLLHPCLMWPVKALCQPLHRRPTIRRRWRLSRWPKTPWPRPSLRRWLSRSLGSL